MRKAKDFKSVFDDIIDIIRSAAITLERLPDRDKPARYRALTPVYVHWGMEYEKRMDTPVRYTPSAKEIDTMDMVLFKWLPMLDKRERTSVWGFACDINRKLVAKEARVCRQHLYTLCGGAVLKIAFGYLP